MRVSVRKQVPDVCTNCKTNIATAAERSGLNSLTIEFTNTIEHIHKRYVWKKGSKKSPGKGP